MPESFTVIFITLRKIVHCLGVISDCESSDSESAVGNLSFDEDLSDGEADNDDKEAWDSGEQAKSVYIE